MKVAAIYCYPIFKERVYFPLAKRFAHTWMQHPPPDECELWVGTNGTDRANNMIMSPFSGIPHNLIGHDNSGWDIGLFQKAADRINSDLMIFMGAPVHFHKDGWFERMVDAYVEHGPNLYGCWAYLSPNWHVRTTCFWCHPELVRSYPKYIGSSKKDRYEFEHGGGSFTRHVIKLGLEAMMVTRKGIFPFNQWRDHAPGPDDSLVLDQWTHK